MNGYLLVLAAFVVSAGRVGDIFGRRRVFVTGMAAFAGGSIVAALSDSEETLVAARILQGLGGSALLGLSLAIVRPSFPRTSGPARSASGPECRRSRWAWDRSSAAPWSRRSAGAGCSG